VHCIMPSLSKKKQAVIQIYTDGACRGNPGPGGWGTVMYYQQHQKKLSGFVANTTNNQMELRAAIEGLKAIRAQSDPIRIDLFTDSVYVKNGITIWIKAWRVRHWKTANKSAVKNKALWKELDALVQQYDVHWYWVKGHSGDVGNELADQLAREAIIQAID